MSASVTYGQSHMHLHYQPAYPKACAGQNQQLGMHGSIHIAVDHVTLFAWYDVGDDAICWNRTVSGGTRRMTSPAPAVMAMRPRSRAVWQIGAAGCSRGKSVPSCQYMACSLAYQLHSIEEPDGHSKLFVVQQLAVASKTMQVMHGDAIACTAGFTVSSWMPQMRPCPRTSFTCGLPLNASRSPLRSRSPL
jgi:hypothetical protein